MTLDMIRSNVCLTRAGVGGARGGSLQAVVAFRTQVWCVVYLSWSLTEVT